MRRTFVLWLGSFIVLFFLSYFTLFSTSMEAYFRTDSIDEYEVFWQKETPPESFVRYEDISYWGEFLSFYMLMRDSNSYCYGLEYYTGERIEIDIWKADELVHEDPLINESEDLRTYWNTVSGTVVINGVGFRYLKGKLFYIEWRKDGCNFHLTVENLHEYPHVEGDLISQLLMRDTVEDAIEVLLGRKEYIPPQPSTDTVTDTATDTATTDAIPSGGEDASFPWLWIALPVGEVVIAGGAAFVLIRNKRKSSPNP